MKVIYHGTSTESPDVLVSKLLNSKDFIAVDVETVSLIDKTIIGIGIAISTNDSFYCPIFPECSEIIEQVYRLTTRSDITKIYHNGNFDIEGLRQYAVSNNLPEPDIWNIADTNLMANNAGLWPDLHTLGRELLNDYSLFTIPQLLDEARKVQGKRNVTMLDVPLDKVALKCCNDVRTTYRLHEVIPQHPHWNSRVEDCYNTDLHLTSWLKVISRKGFKLDKPVLRDKYNDLILQAEELEEWAEEFGISISSNQQLGMYLANDRIVLPLTKSGRQLDTSEEVLEKVNHPMAKAALEYRGIRKTLSTYLEPYLGADRAYTNFRLDLSTGRLASFDRNLQNVPPDLRCILSPDSGTFSYGDMSQAEMRTFAFITKDPVMKKAYDDGISIHEVTFRGIYPDKVYDKNTHDYTLAKSFNFAMIFNAEDDTLASRFKVPFKLAKQIKADWLALYHVGHQWMLDMINTDFSCNCGCGLAYVEDIFGRKMLLPDAFRGQKHIDTCKISYTIQGSVASANKRALLYTMTTDNPDMRLQVHDEFIVDGIYEFRKELDEIYKGLYIPFENKQANKWF